MKTIISQLLRFSGIGVLVNLGGYLLYLAVTAAGVGHKIAMSVIFGLGVLAGFFANRKFTFEHRGGGVSAWARFLLVNAFGYLLNLTILLIFVDEMAFPHEIVQIFAIIFVAVFNFLLLRFFVFV